MINFSLTKDQIDRLKAYLDRMPLEKIIISLAMIISLIAIGLSWKFDKILAYGDAESHINIAKRVVDSITPGFAQLGGIWLPLPHLLMLPFVKSDFLWRTGLGGAFVSGVGYIISCLFVYKFSLLVLKNKLASFFAFIVFATNPNIIYLQTTPLTEVLLITFIILSTYFFTKFIFIALQNNSFEKVENLDSEYINLIFAALFAFCASLSRYDGWFLVLIESLVIIFIYLPKEKYIQVLKEKNFKGVIHILTHKFYLNKKLLNKLQGMIVLFSALAFFGIGLWLLWDGLILGDPFYFTTSEYSAKSQQLNWLRRGQLPAQHNAYLSFMYYTVDSMSNLGVIIFAMAVVGFIVYLVGYKKYSRILISLILLVPFIFNVLTLYIGQSVIFIPHLTPVGFDWRLFNARYGIIMLPFAAFFISFLFDKVKNAGKLLIVGLFLAQFLLYISNYSPVIAYKDGVDGLSKARRPDAERWLSKNYDYGLMVMDDFSRSTSVVRSGIPMRNIIYIGNKPYWQESLTNPENIVRWIIMQKSDEIWKSLYENPDKQDHLYKYFEKVYTSPDILIFKRNNEPPPAYPN